MTKWLNYSNNISFERTDYSYGGFWEIDGSDGLASNGILYDIMRNVGPNITPYNPDGTINIQSGYMADATSPLFSGRGGTFMDGRNHNQIVNNYLTITNRFTANIAKGLQFIADYTYRRRDQLKAYRSLPSANCYDNANKRMYKGADDSVPQGSSRMVQCSTSIRRTATIRMAISSMLTSSTIILCRCPQSICHCWRKLRRLSQQFIDEQAERLSFSFIVIYQHGEWNYRQGQGDDLFIQDSGLLRPCEL